jgi:hypothetical protein
MTIRQVWVLALDCDFCRATLMSPMLTDGAAMDAWIAAAGWEVVPPDWRHRCVDCQRALRARQDDEEAAARDALRADALRPPRPPRPPRPRWPGRRRPPRDFGQYPGHPVV